MNSISVCVRPLAMAAATYVSSICLGATITVNDVSTASVFGSCTIVDAVASINQGTAAGGCVNNDKEFGIDDRIVFSSEFSMVFSAPTVGSSSALVLTKPAMISGLVDAQGKPLTTIVRDSQTSSHFRLLESSAPLVLQGLSISGGDAVGDGGAVRISGPASLSVLNSNIAGNAASGSGGGIYAEAGTVTIAASRVSGNKAYNGGGIFNYPGTTRLSSSTVSGNSGGAAGGGIYSGAVDSTMSTISRNVADAGGGLYTSAPSTLSETTVSGNAADIGGGIYASGEITIVNSTISSNRAAEGGGVVVFFDGNTMVGTIVSGNTGLDVVGFYFETISGDHDIVGTHGSVVTLPTDTMSCDPRLGPLTNNGGPTLTHALWADSCAIDAGRQTADPAKNDQRGRARKMGLSVDIGAFEKQGPDDPDAILSDGFDS